MNATLEAPGLDIEAAYHAVSDPYLGLDVDIHTLCTVGSFMVGPDNLGYAIFS